MMTKPKKKTKAKKPTQLSQIRVLKKEIRELKKGSLADHKTISTARDDGYADDRQYTSPYHKPRLSDIY